MNGWLRAENIVDNPEHAPIEVGRIGVDDQGFQPKQQR